MFCGIKSYNESSNVVFRYTDTGPQSFCNSFIALLMLRCMKLAQKYAVQMREVATVVMVTTQLVLSQFKNFLSPSMEN